MPAALPPENPPPPTPRKRPFQFDTGMPTQIFTLSAAGGCVVTALTRQFVADGWQEYRETLLSMSITLGRAIRTLLWDLRYSLLTVALAAFGRAASEVGAVMVVGGNIDGVTRVMTTAIALETSKGDLPLALGLGIVLLSLILVLNAAAYGVKELAQRRYG